MNLLGMKRKLLPYGMPLGGGGAALGAQATNTTATPSSGKSSGAGQGGYGAAPGFSGQPQQGGFFGGNSMGSFGQQPTTQQQMQAYQPQQSQRQISPQQQSMLGGTTQGLPLGQQQPSAPQSNMDFLQNLYQTTFNRAGDQGGLDYHNQQMQQGMSREDVTRAFQNSPEFRQMQAAQQQQQAQQPMQPTMDQQIQQNMGRIQQQLQQQQPIQQNQMGMLDSLNRGLPIQRQTQQAPQSTFPGFGEQTRPAVSSANTTTSQDVLGRNQGMQQQGGIFGGKSSGLGGQGYGNAPGFGQSDSAVMPSFFPQSPPLSSINTTTSQDVLGRNQNMQQPMQQGPMGGFGGVFGPNQQPQTISGLQGLFNNMRNQNQMLRGQQQNQMPNFQSQALQFIPNMQNSRAALSRVKPSVQGQQQDAQAARIAELEAQLAGMQTPTGGSYDGGGG